VAPIALAHERDEQRLDLAGLDEGQNLEQPVERAIATRKSDQCLCPQQQMHLAQCKLAISTDSTDMLAYMRFGIDQARRRWLTRDDAINTRSLSELRKLLKR
jgi:hypothetical protein